MDYAPLQHALDSLGRKYSEEKKRTMPIHYRDDLMRSMRAVCKIIRLDLETLTSKNTWARQIGRCLYSELDLLDHSSDVQTVMTEFTKTYMMKEESREELRQMIQGRYTCEPELSEDDEEECLSECGTDCDESTVASERSGYHRLRMTIRELLGPRRTEVVYAKKQSKKRQLRRV
jgi:hypothetical protein